MRCLTSFLLMLYITSHVFAQSCDEKIREMGKGLGSLGYQPRDSQKRCEGLYYDNVSGVSIDLVSLTVGPLRYRLRPDEVINIQWQNDMTQTTALIRGTSFRSRPKYRLDLSLSDTKKNTVKLAVKDVLNESRISSTDVGFFGYIAENNAVVYFPVFITSKFYGVTESDNIYVTVLSNVETSQVVYKIAESSGAGCGIFSPQVKLDTGYEKTDPIIIEISSGYRGKTLCFEVAVLPAGTDTQWESEQFRMQIPGK